MKALTADLIAAALVAAQKAAGQPVPHLEDPACFVKKLVLAAAITAVGEATKRSLASLAPVMLLWLDEAAQRKLIATSWWRGPTFTVSLKAARSALARFPEAPVTPPKTARGRKARARKAEAPEAILPPEPGEALPPAPVVDAVLVDEVLPALPAVAARASTAAPATSFAALGAAPQAPIPAGRNGGGVIAYETEAAPATPVAQAPALPAVVREALPPVPPVRAGRHWTRAYIAERERIIGLHRARARELAVQP